MRIRDYLNHKLQCAASNGFAQCNTIEKLQSYEREKCPENDRATHVEERNKIYEAILRDPTEASCFLHYQRYIKPENGIAFDFNAWYTDDPRDLVLQLLSIFPIKD